ncbi:hypothetical protein QW180_14105 [Vibrio sinaloensis]|nr:hypothetical protein [Vibrio sinaloensis]
MGRKWMPYWRIGAFVSFFWRNMAEDCARLVIAERADVWVNNDFGARSILASEEMEQELEILSPPIEATPSYIAFFLS